jgi:hypothetical protein
MPKLAETNAEWLRHLIDHTSAIIIALGRVLTLLQGLRGYTRGCARTHPWRILHKLEGLNPKNLEGSSLCRTDTHSYKDSGATVGYHNMGHPNLRIKTSSKMQNTIRQPVQRPPGALPSPMLGCPNPLQVPKAQIHTWPTTQHQSMAHPRPHKPQSDLRLA